MASIWKYSTLSDKERLKMIENGNTEVYDAEKAKNKIIKDSRVTLGMSTDQIDAWDRLITNAKRKSKKDKEEEQQKNVAPKFMSVKEEMAYRKQKEYEDKATDAYNDSREKAIDEANSDSEYLSEWFAANGYSKKGNTYKKAQKDVNDTLAKAIEKLLLQYKETIEGYKA